MQCSETGCDRPVVFSFVWPWGDQASCCGEHRTHVQQKSDALGRGQISFTVLEPNKPQPLGRDERTQLLARSLSAEAETVNVKARAAELYNSNAELTAECRRLRAQNAELKSQVADRTAEVEQVARERDDALADAGEAKLERERLEKLIRPSPRDDTRWPKGSAVKPDSK